MESLNLNLSHLLFGLYKIIISSVAGKIGYIIELPSRTCSRVAKLSFEPYSAPLGREEVGRMGERAHKGPRPQSAVGSTLLLIQLPGALLCCLCCIWKLGHRRAFWGSVCCLSGDHTCATYAFPDLFTLFYW